MLGRTLLRCAALNCHQLINTRSVCARGARVWFCGVSNVIRTRAQSTRGAAADGGGSGGDGGDEGAGGDKVVYVMCERAHSVFIIQNEDGRNNRVRCFRMCHVRVCIISQLNVLRNKSALIIIAYHSLGKRAVWKNQTGADRRTP